MLIAILFAIAFLAFGAWIVWREVGMDVFWCDTCKKETWHRKYKVFEKHSWRCLTCGVWHERKRKAW